MSAQQEFTEDVARNFGDVWGRLAEISEAINGSDTRANNALTEIISVLKAIKLFAERLSDDVDDLTKRIEELEGPQRVTPEVSLH